MLKLYRAYANHGEIGIDNFIIFDHGKFNTGYDGFGTVIGKFGTSEDNFQYNAKYLLNSLESFRSYLKSVKLNDGFVHDFRLLSLANLTDLEKNFGFVKKTIEDYEKHGLNEEAVLLFTQFINLKSSDGLTERKFGRDLHTGMYILLPNAKVSMRIETQPEGTAENYEVLQSNGLGKQLVLTRLPRKI